MVNIRLDLFSGNAVSDTSNNDGLGDFLDLDEGAEVDRGLRGRGGDGALGIAERYRPAVKVGEDCRDNRRRANRGIERACEIGDAVGGRHKFNSRARRKRRR